MTAILPTAKALQELGHLPSQFQQRRSLVIEDLIRAAQSGYREWVDFGSPLHDAFVRELRAAGYRVQHDLKKTIISW